MDKRFLLVIALLIVAISLGIVTSRRSPRLVNATENPQPRSVLGDIGASKLTATEKASLDRQIEDWEWYTENPSVELGTGDCGNPEDTAIIQQFNEGSKKHLRLNNAFDLVITPNHRHWNERQFQAYRNSPTAVCGVGGIYPRKFYPDYILWTGVCSAGALPTPGIPSFHEAIHCFQAEEVVNDHLGDR